MAANNSATKPAVESIDNYDEKQATSGFFNISSVARKKVHAKRERRGLGEIKPREHNPYG